MSDLSGLYRADDPRLADFTPEEIARGLPEQIAKEELAAKGTGNETDDNTPDDETPIEDPAITLARQQQAQRRTDAFSSLRALLSRVGLSELEGAVRT